MEIGYPLCGKCNSCIKRGIHRLPPQSIHHGQDAGQIPDCLDQLSSLELDFIKRVRPFMKIRTAPSFRGQDRMEGGVVQFTKVIHEIVKFNPKFKISSFMPDTVIVTEHLEQIQRHREFALRLKKLML